MLEDIDIDAVKQEFGPECLKDEKPILILSKGYSNELTFNGLNVDTDAALKHLIKDAGLPTPLTEQLLKEKDVEAIMEALDNAEQTEALLKLTPTLQNISKHSVSYVIYDKILGDRIPKFLYFDEYYQLKGEGQSRYFQGAC